MRKPALCPALCAGLRPRTHCDRRSPTHSHARPGRPLVGQVARSGDLVTGRSPPGNLYVARAEV